jgi:hypothetical protein
MQGYSLEAWESFEVAANIVMVHLDIIGRKGSLLDQGTFPNIPAFRGPEIPKVFYKGLFAGAKAYFGQHGLSRIIGLTAAFPLTFYGYTGGTDNRVFPGSLIPKPGIPDQAGTLRLLLEQRIKRMIDF